MELTNAEKLILTMLADIHEKLGIQTVDTKLLQNAIYSHNTWALSWGMPGIVGDSPEQTPREVRSVVNILDMWSFIEGAYEGLDQQEKADLKSKADPFGDKVLFPGFDGNNESEYLSIASCLIDDLKRFQRFSGRGLNSHCPVIDGYHRMLSKFEGIRPNLEGRSMSVDELADVLNARRAP